MKDDDENNALPIEDLFFFSTVHSFDALTDLKPDGDDKGLDEHLYGQNFLQTDLSTSKEISPQQLEAYRLDKSSSNLLLQSTSWKCDLCEKIIQWGHKFEQVLHKKMHENEHFSSNWSPAAETSSE